MSSILSFWVIALSCSKYSIYWNLLSMFYQCLGCLYFLCKSLVHALEYSWLHNPVHPQQTPVPAAYTIFTNRKKKSHQPYQYQLRPSSQLIINKTSKGNCLGIWITQYLTNIYFCYNFTNPNVTKCYQNRIELLLLFLCFSFQKILISLTISMIPTNK